MKSILHSFHIGLISSAMLVPAHASFPGFTTQRMPGSIDSYNPVFQWDLGRVMQIEAGDLDNDGRKDIVFSSDYVIAWHRNLGSRRFSKPIVIHDQQSDGSSLQSLKIADMNGDGHQDLIVGYAGFYQEQSGLYVHFGKGNGTFAKREEWYFWGGGGGRDIEIRDMNGDGHLDITIVGNAAYDPSSVHISFNDGSGHEARTRPFAGSFSSTSADITIVDPRLSPSRPRNARRLAIDDLDGDGNLDVLVGSSTGHGFLAYGGLDAMRNQGSGRFVTNRFNPIAENRVYDTSDGPVREYDDRILINDIALANVDSTGYPDAIAAMEYHTIHRSGYETYDRLHEGIFWWPNKGGMFKDNVKRDLRVVASKPKHRVPLFVAADFDRDGDDDVIAFFYSLLNDRHKLQYLDNQNGGNFKAVDTNGTLGKGTPRMISGMASADVDGDGDMDIILAADPTESGKYGIWVLYNGSKAGKDKELPQIQIAAPRPRTRMLKDGMVHISGSATDNGKLDHWQYRLNGGRWLKGGELKGASSAWSRKIGKARKGNNLLEVRVVDVAGNRSLVIWRKFKLS